MLWPPQMPPTKKPQPSKAQTAATSMSIGYMPFADVISDPVLMKPLWDRLSQPQQVCLKAFYGLPLDPTNGDLAIWSVLQDSCSYDSLGYVTDVTLVPYVPQEYDMMVGILGRRSGKSSQITALAVLYEAIFGGHMADAMPGQDVVIPYIAQDLATAKANMIFIALLAQEVPLLNKQLISASRDKIELRNGISILPEPPAIKTGRGFAMPVVVGDEVGFWYRTADAANPDYEVQRAVTYAQSQFTRAKQFLISTPYTQEGLLWDYHRAGTSGHKAAVDERAEYDGCLVLQASTAAMQNPKITRKRLAKLQAEDPEAFVRESLARFVTAISGFLPSDLVLKATEKDKKERLRSENEGGALLPNYVAAMDPAFRHDSFAFSIFHMNDKGEVIQDLLRTWTPNLKMGIKNDPSAIMAEIGQIVHQWNIGVVYSDQYQLESLQQLAQQHQFSIVGRDFTGQSKAKMYGSLLHLFRTDKIKLLDNAEQISQLCMLQKKQNPMGHVRIAAPQGRHDDIASVIALGVSVALQMTPNTKPIVKEPSMFELGVAAIKRRSLESEEAWA